MTKTNKKHLTGFEVFCGSTAAIIILVVLIVCQFNNIDIVDVWEWMKQNSETLTSIVFGIAVFDFLRDRQKKHDEELALLKKIADKK